MNTTARAAEKEVEAQLLRAGWNTSVPSVDTGVDILATRDGRVIRIQVKSCCRVQADGSYRFDLRTRNKYGKSTPRDWSAEVDYLFFVAGPGLAWAAPACECRKSALHLRENDRFSAMPQEVLA